MARPDVRAIILTSSRASPKGKVDAFSDYDVIVSVTNSPRYFADKSWLADFGPVLVVYHDPVRKYFGGECFREITQYETGLKIDFNVWPTEVLARVAAEPALPDELDIGYKVLLDKDGAAASLKPPTYKAHIPKPPTEHAYLTVVEDFFQEGTNVAKHLWRDDLLTAKLSFDQGMKLQNLYTMFVWQFEINHGWSVLPGDYGKGFKKRVSPEVWTELETTYVGACIEENWNALFGAVALFRKIARDVGQRLGYVYPEDMHRGCMRYFERVRKLDRHAANLVVALADSS